MQGFPCILAVFGGISLVFQGKIAFSVLLACFPSKFKGNSKFELIRLILSFQFQFSTLDCAAARARDVPHRLVAWSAVVHCYANPPVHRPGPAAPISRVRVRPALPVLGPSAHPSMEINMPLRAAKRRRSFF